MLLQIFHSLHQVLESDFFQYLSEFKFNLQQCMQVCQSFRHSSFRREQWIHSGHDQLKTVESHHLYGDERESECVHDCKIASSCYHYQTRPVVEQGDRTCPGSILPSHSATHNCERLGTSDHIPLYRCSIQQSPVL